MARYLGSQNATTVLFNVLKGICVGIDELWQVVSLSSLIVCIIVRLTHCDLAVMFYIDMIGAERIFTSLRVDIT